MFVGWPLVLAIGLGIYIAAGLDESFRRSGRVVALSVVLAGCGAFALWSYYADRSGLSERVARTLGLPPTGE